MDNIAALAGLRAVVGASAWTAPDLSGRLFGLDPDANPQASYLGRLFGVRDLVLGVGTLRAEPPARKLWLQAGIACDLADAAASLLGKRNGTLSTFTGVGTAVIALAAVGMGVAALQDE
jgi:hypothetical protein